MAMSMNTNLNAVETTDGDDEARALAPSDTVKKEEARESRDLSKAKRRRVALFMGYVGEQYLGMQRNHGVTTVEGTLMDALFKAGCVPEEFKDDFAKLKWARAARTDKGVSAVGQVVSANLRCEVDAELQHSFIEKINQYLPNDIRVFGWLRSTGSFSAKNDCIRRRYEYLMPTDALGKLSYQKDGRDENSHQDNDTDVLGDPRVKRFNQVLQRYHGSHRFHNFTDNMEGRDPTAQRYILSCTCSEPFDVNGKSFVKVVLLGQSFILHQIRKMIGLALQVIWTGIPEEIIDVCLSPEKKLPTPTAPALGLLLSECFFDFYNRQYERDLRRSICLDPFQEKAETFKRDHIYPFIARREVKVDSMDKWIRRLPEFFSVDSGKILGDYAMLTEEKRLGEERRMARLRSLYPVYDELDDLFKEAVSDPDLLERKKEMVMALKRIFDKSYGYSPSSFVRVPGAVVVVGEWQEINDLPALSFALSDEVMVAVAKKISAETVVIRHVLEELADSSLRPNGSRLACTEDPSRVDWARFVSWGWQGGVSGKGARPKSLPSARLVFGGNLQPKDTLQESEAALLTASLLAFMDIHSWKLPRMEMAKMAHGWDRQGRGRVLGLAKYMTILGGVSNSLLVLNFKPKLEVVPRWMPPSLAFVLVLPRQRDPTKDAMAINCSVEEKREKLLRAEFQLAAKLWAKKLGLEDPLGTKSFGAILQKTSIERNMDLVKSMSVEDRMQVTLEDAASDLGVSDRAELCIKYLGGVTDLNTCRAGTLAAVAFGEAQVVLEVSSLLETNEKATDESAREPVTTEFASQLGHLLQRSQELRSQIVTDEHELFQATRRRCLDSGALNATGSGSTHTAFGWLMLCLVQSSTVSEFEAKLIRASGGEKDVLEAEVVVKQVTPSEGGAVWAHMKKPAAADKKSRKRKL